MYVFKNYIDRYIQFIYVFVAESLIKIKKYPDALIALTFGFC